jgi:hypothetical protein
MAHTKHKSPLNFMTKHSKSSPLNSLNRGFNSPLHQNEDEPKKVKVSKENKYGESTEYIKGGREGDKKSRHVDITTVNIPKEDLANEARTGIADEGINKSYKTVTKTKKGVVTKTKRKEISAKRAARIKKRKDKSHQEE